ncbi:MAG: RNA 2',3'-cyclic phosphodiesterase [Methanosarcinales archaeon]|nr:RNA 2',3'-cyclic phosphodiesterase [Methanosarcinales archaeon]
MRGPTRGPGKGIRSFVAVELPAEIRDKVAEIQREISVPGLRMVKPDLVHITMKFLGDVPPARIDDVTRALAGISFPAFPARITGVGAFPGRSVRVVWLGAEGEFADLAAQVEEALHPLGFEREKRRFSAHATLARVSYPSREINDALRPWMERFARLDVGEFSVDQFFLKKSTLTPGGPIYENLARFPLRSD